MTQLKQYPFLLVSPVAQLISLVASVCASGPLRLIFLRTYARDGCLLSQAHGGLDSRIRGNDGYTLFNCVTPIFC